MRTEVIQVGVAAVELTEAIYKVGNFGRAARAYPRALITVESAAIRFRMDGEDPVDAVGGGHIGQVGTIITLENAEEIRKFKAVRSGGSDASLFVSYLPRRMGS